MNRFGPCTLNWGCMNLQKLSARISLLADDIGRCSLPLVHMQGPIYVMVIMDPLIFNDPWIFCGLARYNASQRGYKTPFFLSEFGYNE